jgi:DNA-binding NtrC family response regulator
MAAPVRRARSTGPSWTRRPWLPSWRGSTGPSWSGPTRAPARVGAVRRARAPAGRSGAVRRGRHRPELELPFKEAKERLIEGFERDYLKNLLERCEGNISRAGREAGIARIYVRKLLKKYGLHGHEGSE